MELLIFYFPLISAFVCIFYADSLGQKLTLRFVWYCSILLLIVSYNTFSEMLESKEPLVITVFEYIEDGNRIVYWDLIFDPLSCGILLQLASFSTYAHIYFIDAMRYDPDLPKFLGYLSLLSFFMLILLSGANNMFFF